MLNSKLAVVVAMSFLGSVALAEGKEKAKTEGPCKIIEETCVKAGFVKGESKEGKGLWVDCIDPIMQGKAQPKEAKLALPTVDPATVTACKAKHPKFGQEKEKTAK